MKLTALLILVACAAFAATEDNLNKTFPIAAGGSLVVDVDAGSIDVSTNSVSGQVTVEVWRKVTRKDKNDEEQFLRDNPVQFLAEGNTLTVRCRTKESNRWFSGRGNRNEAKYTIRVPASFNARLNTSGGGLSVRDLIGKVKLGTSGGPIAVKGGGGLLEGETSGGGVVVKNFGGPVSVSSSGGGLTIENVNGKVKGSTSGGPVNAILLSPIPGDVDLSTSGGGVTVRVPDKAMFNLDAETSGGGVTCDLPVTVQGKIEHSHLKGPVNGGGPTVLLRSSGGGIHIKKQ